MIYFKHKTLTAILHSIGTMFYVFMLDRSPCEEVKSYETPSFKRNCQ